MGSPTHFHSGGVSNVRGDKPLGQMGQLDPTKFHTYFNDFDNYVAAEWAVTEVGIATQALADGDGGLLLVTNAAGISDSSFQQKVGESFKFVAGKKLWFKARFKVSAATEGAFVMGLQITDTAPLDVTHGVFFQKDDGDANLDFHIEKGNVASDSAAIHTVAADTFIEVAFYYNGDDEIVVFVDDVAVTTLAVTNLPDDEDLTISFGVGNGEAVAKTMSVDYVMACKER